jgi:hypothetical protein
MIQQFKEMFTKAHEIINEKEAAKEATKQGIWRIGSSGAIVDGKVYSTQCGRLAQARYLGFQSQPTEEMRYMFNGGLTLESFISERLDILGFEYTKEAEIKTIIEGIELSGRPDFRVKLDSRWIGIEVKSLASPFSVIKLKKNRAPFMKHMIQSCMYMMATQSSKWMVVVGWSFNVNQNGKKIESGMEWFEIEGKGNKFIVRNELGEEFTLPFTCEDLLQYYKDMQQGITDKKLMPRPFEHELNVDTYNRCNYCPQKNACNEYDANKLSFEDWLKRVPITKETK